MFASCDTQGGDSSDSQSTKPAEEEKVITDYEECYGINDNRNTFWSYILPSTVKRLKMPDVFGDYMMFQQGKPIRVWGLAPAGEKVAIRLYDKNNKSIAAVGVISYEDNSFIAELPAMQASFDEYSLKVTCGSSERKFAHILIGEVFLASGQSNMQVTLGDTYEGEELLANANNPNIRIYNPPIMPCTSDNNYPYGLNFETQCGVQDWTKGDDKTLSGLGSVSAVGYSCALEMYKQLNTADKQVPVGFLNLPVGGTSIVSWLPRYAADNATLKRMLGSRYLNYSDNGTITYNDFTALFNTKIAPVANFNINGMIWYQGETDAGSPDMYSVALEELAKGYGSEFRFEGNMPMVVCHIAPFNTGAYVTDPVGLTAFNVVFDNFVAAAKDSRALVTLYDCDLRYEKGDLATIHPRVKREIGVRCGKALYGLTCDKTMHEIYTSPVFKNAAANGNKLEVTFANAGGGLVAEGRIMGFAVAGSDKKFYAAEAEIIAEDKVSVSSPYVSAPLYCSYAYSSLNMKANLKSKAGFAVSPFVSVENVGSSDYFCQHDWLFCDDLTCWRYLPPILNADGSYKYTADYVPMYSGENLNFALDKDNAAIGNCLKLEANGQSSSLTVNLDYPYDVHQFNRFTSFGILLKGDLSIEKIEVSAKDGSVVELVLKETKTAANGYTEYIFKLRDVKVNGSLTEKYKYPDFLGSLKITFGGSGTSYLDEMSLGNL